MQSQQNSPPPPYFGADLLFLICMYTDVSISIHPYLSQLLWQVVYSRHSGVCHICDKNHQCSSLIGDFLSVFILFILYTGLVSLLYNFGLVTWVEKFLSKVSRIDSIVPNTRRLKIILLPKWWFSLCKMLSLWDCKILVKYSCLSNIQ